MSSKTTAHKERADQQLDLWPALISSPPSGSLDTIIDELARANVRGLHFDVMSHYLEGQRRVTEKDVQLARVNSDLPIDVHIQVAEPDAHVVEFARAGAGSITINAGSRAGLAHSIELIRSLSLAVGVGFRADAKAADIFSLLPTVDLVLIHTSKVNGEFDSLALETIARVRAHIGALDRWIPIRVDGAINYKTAVLAHLAGATSAVAGSAIFRAPTITDGVSKIRDALPRRLHYEGK